MSYQGFVQFLGYAVDECGEHLSIFYHPTRWRQNEQIARAILSELLKFFPPPILILDTNEKLGYCYPTILTGEPRDGDIDSIYDTRSIEAVYQLIVDYKPSIRKYRLQYTASESRAREFFFRPNKTEGTVNRERTPDEIAILPKNVRYFVLDGGPSNKA